MAAWQSQPYYSNYIGMYMLSTSSQIFLLFCPHFLFWGEGRGGVIYLVILNYESIPVCMDVHAPCSVEYGNIPPCADVCVCRSFSVSRTWPWRTTRPWIPAKSASRRETCWRCYVWAVRAGGTCACCPPHRKAGRPPATWSSTNVQAPTPLTPPYLAAPPVR